MKDNKFESNSQLGYLQNDSEYVVFGLSKIISLKAIHNGGCDLYGWGQVVFGLSKIISLKAIHNKFLAVVEYGGLFSDCQR